MGGRQQDIKAKMKGMVNTQTDTSESGKSMPEFSRKQWSVVLIYNVLFMVLSAIRVFPHLSAKRRTFKQFTHTNSTFIVDVLCLCQAYSLIKGGQRHLALHWAPEDTPPLLRLMWCYGTIVRGRWWQTTTLKLLIDISRFLAIAELIDPSRWLPENTFVLLYV
jgi:hypothetical protein